MILFKLFEVVLNIYLNLLLILLVFEIQYDRCFMRLSLQHHTLHLDLFPCQSHNDGFDEHAALLRSCLVKLELLV